MAKTAEPLRYAYAVTRRSPRTVALAAGLTGIGDAPVRLVGGASDGRLAVLAGDVPAADFEEAALRARLENLGWLEDIARAHHHVVDAVALEAAVLPLRLATVFRDDERLRARLAEEEPEYAALLARVSGHQEWGVKVYATEPEPSPVPSARPRTGRDYLRQRRRERAEQEGRLGGAERLAAEIDAAARSRAGAVCRYRPQSSELSGTPGTNVLNSAYLLPDSGVEEFRGAVERAAAAAPDVRVEVTGPWAPYSFARSGTPEEVNTAPA
jgi:hypothetical protein